MEKLGLHRTIDPDWDRTDPASLHISPVAPGADETPIWDNFRGAFQGTETNYLPPTTEDGKHISIQQTGEQSPEQTVIDD